MRTSVVALCLCLGLVGFTLAQESLYVRLVGRWGSSQLTGVAVKGQYAYVVGLDSAIGLHVISIADPARPVRVGFCSASATPCDVAVSGEHAYFANYTAGLRVISISDPTHPVEVGRCTTHSAYSVTVSGGYAYVTDSSGLSVISVTDPFHPTEVGHLRSPGGWHAWYEVDVVGDYAYVAAYGGGMRVISVADPTNPVEVGCYEPGISTLGVALGDEYAYLGCAGSFRVVSVADPTRPVEVGRVDSAGLSHWGIALTHGYAFTAGGTTSGLWAISVSDSMHPALAGYYGGGYGWHSVVADGDYLYYCGIGLHVFQFYQLGDIDIDKDSLDVAADTLRLRRWATVTDLGHDRARKQGTVPPSSCVGLTAGQSPFSQSCPAPFECVRGEFVLANTSTSYNPDSVDGPSLSPVDSIRFTGFLTGPGGTIDSIVIPNLPAMLAQGQTMVCTLAAYVPVGLKVGDYVGSVYISGTDTAGLQVYESCYVFLQKLGDLDVDDDSLDVIVDTMRLTNSGSEAMGEFILANTSASYNPDTVDGPSRSRVDSLSYTGSLVGSGGTIDSILIPNLPQSLAQGQTAVCTLAVYVPDSMPFGDYAGPLVITGADSLGCPLAETVYALLTKVPMAVGDLDVDDDSLDVVRDTMKVRAQPGYVPSGTARFMVVNTTSTYNPDTADGPSRSALGEVKAEVKVEAQTGTAPPCGVYVLNLPETLAVGQAVECTLALVLPAGAKPEDYDGWVVISATDTLGFQVRDSFAAVVSSAEPHQSLDPFRVVPIPFKPNQNPEHDAIHFQGLSSGARVIVYDASGQQVWSATESGGGRVAWDAEVASGIYVYLVVTADGKASKVGKLSVIR